jgi:phenylacetate-coenzyme A ligase PaaK-like adenylate-forming protein
MMSGKLLEEQWQQLPESAVRHLQAERFRQYLRNVVLPFSAHYRKIFEERGLNSDSFHTLDDLQQIPFTTKVDLLNTPERPQKFRDFLIIPDEKVIAKRPGTILRALFRGRQQVKKELESEFRPIFLTFTTGRSAEPTSFFYTQHDLANLTTAARRMVEVCNSKPDDRLLNTLPFAPHLAFWFAHYAGTEAGIMTLSSGGGKVMGTEGNIRLLRHFKPNVIIGIPTFIYHLMHQAVEQGVHCENLKGIVLAGEKVSDGLRHKLRDLATELGGQDVHILATYGFTEAKQAWTECSSKGQVSSGYHLYPDLGIMEVIDPVTGRPVGPGQPGELVFTPLDARGTVVLRYRTGDFIDGGLTYERCPDCGRRLPRLVGNISRRSEVREMNLDKIKGTLVDFNQLEHVLDGVPDIGAWQVELRKLHDDPLELDEVILHVQKISGTDEAQICRELSQRCMSHLEIKPNRILFHSADEIRRLQGVGTLLKEQKLVDNRPKRSVAVGVSRAPEPGVPPGGALLQNAPR